MALVRGVCVDGPCQGQQHAVNDRRGPYRFQCPDGSVVEYRLTARVLAHDDRNVLALEVVENSASTSN